MTHEERIAALEQRYDVLRDQVELLLKESPEDRARREEALWQLERERKALAGQIATATSRVADLDQQIAGHEPWVDCLTKIRAGVVTDIEAEEKACAETTDPREQDERRRQIEHLKGTLRCIDGISDWRSEGDLFERVAATGFPASPGHKTPLGDRFMLPRTLRLVAQLKKERKAAQSELDKLLAQQQAKS